MLKTANSICDKFIVNHKDKLSAVDYELIDKLREHMAEFMQPHVITTYLPDGRTRHSGHRSNAGLMPITKDVNTGEVYLLVVSSHTKHIKNPEYFTSNGDVRLIYSNCHGFAEPGHTVQQTAIKETLEETRNCFGWFEGIPSEEEQSVRTLIRTDPCRLLSALSHSEFHRIVPPGDHNNQWLSIVNMGPTTESERTYLSSIFHESECTSLSQAEARGISFIRMLSLIEGLTNLQHPRNQRLAAVSSSAIGCLDINPTPLEMARIKEYPHNLLRDVFQSRLQPHTDFIRSAVLDCAQGTLRSINEVPMPSFATISFLNLFLTDENLILEPSPESSHKPTTYFYEEWLTTCNKCKHPCGRWPDELSEIRSNYEKTHNGKKTRSESELQRLLYPVNFECIGCQNLRQKRK